MTKAVIRAMGSVNELTKILADSESGRILGAGIIGLGAESFISEVVLAIEGQ